MNVKSYYDETEERVVIGIGKAEFKAVLDVWKYIDWVWEITARLIGLTMEGYSCQLECAEEVYDEDYIYRTAKVQCDYLFGELLYAASDMWMDLPPIARLNLRTQAEEKKFMELCKAWLKNNGLSIALTDAYGRDGEINASNLFENNTAAYRTFSAMVYKVAKIVNEINSRRVRIKESLMEEIRNLDDKMTVKDVYFNWGSQYFYMEVYRGSPARNVDRIYLCGLDMKIDDAAIERLNQYLRKNIEWCPPLTGLKTRDISDEETQELTNDCRPYCWSLGDDAVYNYHYPNEDDYMFMLGMSHDNHRSNQSNQVKGAPDNDPKYQQS